MPSSVNSMLPSGDKLPKKSYEAKKITKDFDIGYEKIHACPNDCMLFSKETENDEVCSTNETDLEPIERISSKRRKKNATKICPNSSDKRRKKNSRRSKGSIAWSSDDIYSQVMGKEQHDCNHCKNLRTILEEDRRRDQRIRDLEIAVSALQKQMSLAMSKMKETYPQLVIPSCLQILEADSGVDDDEVSSKPRRESSANHEM